MDKTTCEIKTKNFKLKFPKECSRNMTLKINKLLMELETELLDSNNTSQIQNTCIKDISAKKACHCSMCGKTLDILDVQENFVFDKSIGYGSSFDTIHLKFRLCCDCMDKLLSKNIVPNLKSVEICEDYLYDVPKPLSLSDLKEYAKGIKGKF